MIEFGARLSLKDNMYASFMMNVAREVEGGKL